MSAAFNIIISQKEEEMAALQSHNAELAAQLVGVQEEVRRDPSIRVAFQM